MTTIVQDIQDIHSMRKELRDPKLPASILTYIESIHTCIKNGIDSNGWKKVDWRNGNSSGRNGNSNERNGNLGGRNGYKDSSESRQSSPQTNRDSHTSFEHRSKNTFNRQLSEPSIRIPLSGNSSNVSNAPVSTTVPNDVIRGPPPKYVSKFKKTTVNVEDTILNTIILGKLNKFSQQNYGEIKEFITHIIDNGETDMIKCFMKLVFEKAASEEIFCPLYDDVRHNKR